MRNTENLVGQSISRYTILEMLGEGGMADVYLAIDRNVERKVAIKFIRRNAFAPEVFDHMRQRFKGEAKALSQLTHPNIVSIIDYGEFEGTPYLVMPFLAGGSLKRYIRHPIPYQEAIRLLKPIAEALEFSHKKGIIHRDVKPGNILLTENGQPMLTDFGVAKLLQDRDDGQTLTKTGAAVGTPEYMAPEQAKGVEIDCQADVYSLGVVLYELITGRKPYTADTPAALLLKQVNDPLPRPKKYVRGLPNKVENVVLKALAKHPEDRYQTMGEFSSALDELVGVGSEGDVENIKLRSGPSIDERSLASKNSFTKGRIRGRSVVVTLLLIFVIGGAGLSALWFLGRSGGGEGQATVAVRINLNATPTIPQTPTLNGTLTPTARLTLTPTFTPTVTLVLPSPTIQLGIGSSIISPKDDMKLLYVPAGEFLMGSKENDYYAYKDEIPQHRVYLDAFWIDQTEVTNGMYALCVNASACQPPSKRKAHLIQDYFGNPKYNDYPVVFVEWDQANTYCKWAGRQLPTEAQWEKAARGTTPSSYPWGEEITQELANYSDINGDPKKVGSYPLGVSPYGALDMAGNVWEWVSDWFSGSYYQNDLLLKNPTGPTNEELWLGHTIRGGSWDNGPRELRVVIRFPSAHSGSDQPDLGFRCALPEISPQ